MSKPQFRSAGSARAALVWTVGILLTVHLGLRIAIEQHWLPQLRDPYYANKAARLRQRLGGVDTQMAGLRSRDPLLSIAGPGTQPQPAELVLMLGSSRTAYGFKGQILEQQLGRDLDRPLVVFNFGIPAAGPVSQLLSLKRLLAEGVRPNLLLVEVLPPLLAGQEPVPAEAHWLPADRLWLPELTILEEQGVPVEELRRKWWHAWLTPWYTHRFAIVSRLSPAWLPWCLRMDWGEDSDESGWTPQVNPDPTPRGRRHALEVARRQYSGFLAGFRVGGAACQAQRELLELCRREGILAALVLMPEGTEFRSWYSAAGWEEVRTFLGGLSREYGVPVINAREWIADEDFSDSHHLTSRGAEVFTERLGREALTPLLQK